VAIEDLVSQQQAEQPADNANVVGEQPQNVDGADVTTENTSDVRDGADTTQDNVSVDNTDEIKSRTQKRIESLLSSNKGMKDELSELKGQLRAITEQQEASRPKTLEDLDSRALNNFIATNEGDDEMADHVSEAKFLLQKKLVQEELGQEHEEKAQREAQEKMAELSRTLATMVGGNDAGNPESELFTLADQKYRILQAELGEDTVQANPLAAALSFALAKAEIPSKASLPNRVINRNERIETASRSPVSSDDSVKSFLRDNPGTLSRSSITSKGSLNQAVRSLSAIRGLTE
jgi:hypothetical protein